MRLLRVARFGQDWFELVDEVAHILELAIDTRKTDKRDMIEFTQLGHHQFADLRRFYFGFVVVVDLAFDRRNDGFDLVVADRPLPASLGQAVLDLLAIERNPRAVFLHDFDHRIFDAFVRGRAAMAADAFAAAANAVTIVTGARIEHPVVVGFAVRTSHRSNIIAQRAN
jgi:hypothetical protein